MAAEDDDPRVRQLGQYIRLQRQMADLSLRGMADLTKVSNAYLSQIERGLHQPSLRVLQAIAEALNIPADTLLAEAGLVSGTAEPVRRAAHRNGGGHPQRPRPDAGGAGGPAPDLPQLRGRAISYCLTCHASCVLFQSHELDHAMTPGGTR